MPRAAALLSTTCLTMTACAALGLSLSAATDSPAGRGPAQTTATRTVLVTAVDGKGVPVTDLTAGDLTLKEDGKTRKVTTIAAASAPLMVVLMIDDSGLGLQSIREGAAAFVTRLQGRAAVALVTTGGRNVKVLDFTDSTATLMAGINRIFARNAPGGFLVDGVLMAATELGRLEAARPVIMSVGVEGDDFSQAKPADVIATLQRSRTQLYMVRLGQPVVGRSNPMAAERGESMADEMTRFNAVLGQAPARTGGRIEQLASHSGIPTQMAAMAAELASQYEVTYEGANLATPDLKLEVSTSRRGVRLRAPQRVGLPK